MNQKTILSFVVFAALICGVGVVSASDARTVDARSLLPARFVQKTADNLQVLTHSRTVWLDANVLRDLAVTAPADLVLSHFPMPGDAMVDLNLSRTSAVMDANTHVEHGTPNGMKPLTVRPIVSYVGTVNGDPTSRVSLHFSERSMIGVIEQSGRTLLIDRDDAAAPRKGDMPLVVADQNVVLDDNPMKHFLCGTMDLPVSEEVVRIANSHVHSKPIDKAQNSLRELNIAIEIKEDIQMEFLARGQTDEDVAQYFAMIVACMNQTFEQEVLTRFYIGFLRIYNEFEPSPYTADGTEPGQLLGQFARHWSRNEGRITRDLAHHFAKIRPVGGGFVGGIAQGGNGNHNLCNSGISGSYAVSTVYYSRNTVLPGLPSVSRAFTWDCFVIAHEIGHNIGSWHTHSCNWPPADRDSCQVREDIGDACASGAQNRRSRPGTIMSYCHIPNGNTTPFTFGPGVASRMRQWIESAPCAREPLSPTVSITAPRGRETFNGNTILTVQWVSARVQNVRLEYSVDNGKAWLPIVASVPAVDRKYDWTLPNVETSELLIRLLDVTNNAVADTTLAVYSIISPLTLTAPLGGERIPSERPFNISWSRIAAIGACRVEFSSNNGVDWSPIVASTTEMSVQWLVPNVTTSQARIRVTAVASPTVTVQSNQFTIGRPSIAALLPTASDSICNNQPNQFRWSADFVDRVRIDFSTDGMVWRNALQQPSADATAGQIFSISNLLRQVSAGTTISIRMRSTADTAVEATIGNLAVRACDNISSVSEAQAQPTGLALQSVSPNPARTEAVITFSVQHAASINVSLVSSNGTVLPLVVGRFVEPGSDQRLLLPLSGVAQGAFRILVQSGADSATLPLSIVR